jgi:Ion channel
VAAVFALGNWWSGRRRLRKRYEGMVGDGYVGWGFADDEAAELVRKAQSQSEARVEYVARNILRIHVAHDGRQWTGEMSMENEHFGIVVWRYTDVADGKESFGFKRIMVSKEPGLVKLLLVGEHPFGLEVFERVVTAGAPPAEGSGRTMRGVLHLPLVWVILYVCLVPLAAFTYYRMPTGSFYDANLLREAGVQHDAAALRDALTGIIQQQVGPAWTAGSTTYLVTSPPRVSVVTRTSDGRYFIDIAGRFTAADNSSAGAFDLPVEILIHERTAVFPPGKPALFGFAAQLGTPEVSQPQLPSFAPPLSLLLPVVGGTSPNRTASELLLPIRTFNQLVRFYNAVGGDPKDASGLWWRMTYFSATTATTLGLGDITPLTTSARLVVTAQAGLQIIVIGFFLNAIALSLSRQQHGGLERGT